MLGEALRKATERNVSVRFQQADAEAGAPSLV